MSIPTSKTCQFDISEDIMTKFELQALHNIRIKYQKAGWSGNTLFFFLALWKIVILLPKQANSAKYFGSECILFPN